MDGICNIKDLAKLQTPEINKTYSGSILHIIDSTTFCYGSSTVAHAVNESIGARVDKAQPANVDLVSPGTVWLAEFEDGGWYRALVLEQVQLGAVKVLFIDFGNEVVVQVDSQMKFLPKELWNIPPNAIICVWDENKENNKSELLNSWFEEAYEVEFAVVGYSVEKKDQTFPLILPTLRITNLTGRIHNLEEADAIDGEETETVESVEFPELHEQSDADAVHVLSAETKDQVSMEIEDVNLKELVKSDVEDTSGKSSEIVMSEKAIQCELVQAVNEDLLLELKMKNEDLLLELKTKNEGLLLELKMKNEELAELESLLNCKQPNDSLFLSMKLELEQLKKNQDLMSKELKMPIKDLILRIQSLEERFNSSYFDHLKLNED